jgi:hypothetical protein
VDGLGSGKHKKKKHQSFRLVLSSPLPLAKATVSSLPLVKATARMPIKKERALIFIVRSLITCS